MVRLIAWLVVFAFIACGRGPACPRAQGGKSDAPTARPCKQRAERPCIRREPPQLVLVGDDAVDRIRREDHRRELSSWAAFYWEVCGDHP